MRVVVLLLSGCSLISCTGKIAEDDEEEALILPESTPTMADCRAWLAEDASATVDHLCPSDAYRETLGLLDGAVFPLGNSRYYTAWFPPGWDEEGVIFAVHGSAGCAEMMTDLFAATAQDRYAVVAVQFGEASSQTYDDEDTLYANLKTAYDEVAAHCPIADTPRAYFGYSRGAGRAFGVSLRDATDAGLFDAFIADSGTNSTSLLAGWDADTLSESRFWMWCGTRDPDPIDSTRTTCEVMEQDMAPWVEAHSGAVDALIQEDGGCHGMFFTDCDAACGNCRRRTAEDLGESLPLLFSYLDGL